jgi:ferredoxin-type protein NapG
MFLPTVHADACTGCGKCERSCVLPEAAIKVLPHKLARGEPGAHYRKGWTPENQPGRPKFDAPMQNLPAEPVPGDLETLRSGGAPYPASPGGTGAARR